MTEIATANVPLYIEQAATFKDSLVCADENGAPVDLAGRSAHMQIRSANFGLLMAVLSSANGGFTLNAGGTIGKIDLCISAAQTLLMINPNAEYDLVITAPGSDTFKARE